MNQPPQRPDAGWASRHVLVTGADGFVGYWLVKALAARGAKVHALMRDENESNRNRFPRSEATPVFGNITDLAAMSKVIRDPAIDTVYHLAANNVNTGTATSPYEIFETNIRGVYSILEACRNAPTPARVVVSSSKEVEDCFVPASSRKRHPYMTSKAAAELVSRAYNDTFHVSVALARSDNIYGGGDFNWSRLVPGTVRAVLRGETPVIRGDGSLRRDYVYVEDAVEAYLAIGAQLDDPAVKGQLFRIATGTGTSVLEIVKQISRAAGALDLEPRVLNEKSEERIDTIYQPEFERRVLGWESRHPLAEGLARTCQWYRDFLGK